jgi:hypothetical protein
MSVSTLSVMRHRRSALFALLPYFWRFIKTRFYFKILGCFDAYPPFSSPEELPET